jgi:hypothetical protein
VFEPGTITYRSEKFLNRGDGGRIKRSPERRRYAKRFRVSRGVCSRSWLLDAGTDNGRGMAGTDSREEITGCRDNATQRKSPRTVRKDGQMESTIQEYEVVNKHELSTLVASINALISKGWQPFEGIRVSTPVINDGVAPMYTQVMVKYRQKS